MAAGQSPRRRLSGRAAFALCIAALLAAHAATLVALAAATPWTVDEPNYLAAGMALARRFEFDAFNTILHGPLPLLANQLFFPAGLAAEPEVLMQHKLAARLGMVPFALLAALMTALLARHVGGRRAGCAALLLWILNPIALGHGCLITADMALAATWMLAAWAAARWLARPSLPWLLGLGAALGAALATKYLALFLLPALLAAAALAALRGLRPALLFSRAPGAGAARRLVDLLPASLLCGAAALLVLHTCYLWRPGGYQLRAPARAAAEVDPRDPEAGALSAAFRRLVDVPGAAAALALLPSPWVRGVDYQKLYSEAGGLTTFGDRIGPGFPTYFVAALATKLPLVVLVLLACALLARGPPWPAHAAALVALLIAVPLVYLSFGTSLQIGVRYVLPVVALLIAVAALAAARLTRTRRGGVALAALGLCALVGTARDWPRYVGAFNALAGGRPYLLFGDSNVDWRHASWSPDLDDAELARRYPASQRQGAKSGPRLGLVRAGALDLAAADPRDPTRVYHWLRRFQPLDHLGATYVFDVDATGFARAVGAGTAQPDARGQVELAQALLGAGRIDEALALAAASADAGAAAVQRMARLLRSRDPGDPELLAGWLELGRFDLALAAATPTTPPRLVALAHLGRGDADAAAAVLGAAEAEGRLGLDEALLLATALRPTRPEAALAVLQRHAPPADTPARGAWEQLLRHLDEEVRAVRRVQQRAGGGAPPPAPPAPEGGKRP